MNIIFLDDNDFFCSTLSEQLHAEFKDLQLLIENDFKNLLDLLKNKFFDIIIADYHLLINQHEAIEIINKYYNNKLIILSCGGISTDKIITYFKDVPILEKPFLFKELRQVINNLILKEMNSI